MLRSCRAWARIAFALLGLTAAVSCSSNDGPPVFPVRGKVLVNGKPAAGVTVSLHQTGEKTLVMNPRGVSAADGTFQIGYQTATDGAPAGQYAVTFVWLPPRGETDPEEKPDRLKGRFSNPATAKWKVTVNAGPTELEPFDLK
ncbi:hypothetical protein R5W24_001827 [Gemmata sp. JC717]|uniref:hypothetical protein n=1 Tax=Gemmata algarum TaxID=2975278 RepID=UPI0021BA5667|nr:hypothetical protein [Gemmata algarum]MDY3552739.1 hypothetical protein [Gemmata algarum]